MLAASATLTPIVRTEVPPTKYLRTAPRGTSTSLSGSANPDPPLGWRIPITWNGSPWIETVLPIASAPRPRSVATVAPRTATLSEASVVAVVRNVPCQTV
jgi:hypothetical protein